MLIGGVTLGILTWLSLIFSFMHLPAWLKKFLLNHFIITDLLSITITFLGLAGISHSIMAVIGSITCGLLVNITLIINKNFTTKNLNRKPNGT